MKIKHFPSQYIAEILFNLDPTYTIDTKNPTWFDLENFMTPSKTLYFKFKDSN